MADDITPALTRADVLLTEAAAVFTETYHRNYCSLYPNIPCKCVEMVALHRASGAKLAALLPPDE